MELTVSKSQEKKEEIQAKFPLVFKKSVGFNVPKVVNA